MNRTGWAQLLLCVGICMVSLLVGTAAWLCESNAPQAIMTIEDRQPVLFQNIEEIATLQDGQKKTAI